MHDVELISKINSFFSDCHTGKIISFLKCFCDVPKINEKKC